MVHREEEARARPYLEFEEFHKYHRGDFPYFYNQSKHIRNQLDNTHYNTQFKDNHRERQKDEYIRMQSSNPGDTIEFQLDERHKETKARRLVGQADCKQYWGDQKKLKTDRFKSDVHSKINFFN